ncbi:DUF2480 family protein [Aureibaculum sp. 2210JD6-5]|uniref:DUF2480 family protein n=1 Tax=Aureibaculum sp. 2210JD6-5 TaxID=3103957 RepID=UPI002AAEFEE2|nr:DUF2480 family protein [Aureibaculum sp. 2210JD6-5]MDY7394639.1 DUF2480 family protein [Aureibaculum sp. 2210JD6-5]
MAEEIVNRIANSKLITIDLEDFYPEGERILFDISDWLYEGLILREKDFRDNVLNHNWSQYKNTFVALTCKTDAIIPSWAYLLITTHLSPFTKKVVVGNLELLETTIFQDIINNLDISEYKDKPIIIKGCAEKPIPETASVQLVEKLLPLAKSIMFGEACSTVPLFKRQG